MVDTMHSVSSFVGGVSTVVSEYFECDYEKDCSPLYKAIENAIVQEEEDYDHIAVFLETGLWPHETTPDLSAPSADVQAKTWVTRFNTKEKNKVEWSQLPLHLAIVGGSPSNIVGALVKLYPQGLRCTDDQQMLPLHLALRHGADDEIVAYLLMQFPDAVNAKGKNERTPVDCALRARDKLRGIILETFVEKTKIKLQNQFTNEKEEMMEHLNDATRKLAKVTEEYNAKDEALTALAKNHGAISSDFHALMELKTTMEKELSNQIEELNKETTELKASSKQKIEKLTNEKLTESIELQKKIDALVAEKIEYEQAVQKAKEEEKSMLNELETVERSVVTSASMEDWVTLKQEVDTSQAHRLTKTKSQAKDEIELLKGDIAKTLEESKFEAKELKNELKALQKTVDKLEKIETSAKSSDEVAKLHTEVEKLRADLRERNDIAKAMSELDNLRKTMEMELKKPEGKSQEQLSAIQGAITKVNPRELEGRTLAELATVKAELEKLSLELKETELARKTAASVEELDRALDIALKEANPTAKADLALIKPAVENLRKFISNTKSKDDLVGVAKDVESLKDLLHKKQATSAIQLEASLVKESVDSALIQSAGKVQERELLQMKETVSAMTGSVLENKDTEELEKMKHELVAVKKQLKQVEEVTKTQQDLDSLKKTVEQELLRATEKTEKDLMEMKKAVDAVNMEQRESKNLKDLLAAEIKRASGQTEAELLLLKEKVSGINISDLESKNKGEWDSIRNDMESLKIDLKQKQQDKLDDTDKELAAVKKAIAQINAEQESKNNVKFDELRREMTALREEIAPKTPTTKAKKGRGLMKLFTSRLRRSGTKAKTMSRAADFAAVTSARDAADIVPTILPPRMAALSTTAQACNSDANSSDDEAGPPGLQSIRSNEKMISTSASKEMEVTLALHHAQSRAAAEAQRTAKINAASVQALPSFSPTKGSPAKKTMLPSAMRRVRSMDPSAKTVTIDPYEIVRSWSKATVQASGEVELEPVMEEDVRSY